MQFSSDTQNKYTTLDMTVEKPDQINQQSRFPLWQMSKKKFRAMKEISKMAPREGRYNGRLMQKFYNVQARANWFEREVSGLNVKTIKVTKSLDLLSIECC